MTQIVILDTESTGINTKKDRLVELAALRYDLAAGTVLESLHLLVNPQRQIPAAATKVHGITNAHVADAPTFDQVADAIVEFVAGSKVVIHNARFDVGLLDAELKRLDRDPFAAAVTQVDCSLSLARKLVHGKTVTLDALCDHFGIDRSRRTSHGALIDCELLAQVYQALCALEAKRSAPLEALVGFGLTDALDSFDTQALCERALAIDELTALLESSRKGIEARVRELQNGCDFIGRGAEVVFTERKNTKWESVVKDHLEGVDLTPYEKPSVAMSIRAR